MKIANPITHEGRRNMIPQQIRSFTAYEAHCAKCGDQWADENDYGMPIFRSEREALAEVVEHWGMVRRSDGQLYCAPCSTDPT